jgi:tetratricopeptide (TPR) repeat protein
MRWLIPFLAATTWAQAPCQTGARLFAARQYAEAQEPLWACVNAGTNTKDPAHQLALTYRELKNYDQGWPNAEKALARHPGSVDVLYIAGFLKFRLGDHSESIRLLGQAFRLDNYDWRVHQAFALNYIVMDIRPGALAELETAVKLNPANAELHYQLARLLYVEMRIPESIAASEKALALFPEYTEVYSNLGLCYEVMAQIEKARENYELAIALTGKQGSRDEWPYVNYGAFLTKQGEPERALLLLKEALTRNPKSVKACYYMGRALGKLGRGEEAKPFLEEAIRLDPADSGAYYELGMLLARTGDTARSRQLLDRFKVLKELERGRPATTREVR